MRGTLRRHWLAATLIGAGLVLAGTLYLIALTWRPSANDFPYQGVDVSASTGVIDWPAVKAADAQFAYVAATSGTDGRDARFEENWRGVGDAGLRRGAIHAWSLCRLAADQANNFNTVVPAGDDALPSALAIDFAPDCAARPARDVVIEELKRFIIAVEARTQRPVILLVSRPVEAEYRVTAAIDRPVWSTGNFLPPSYAARAWRMWRANDMRRIDGVDRPINWDVVAK